MDPRNHESVQNFGRTSGVSEYECVDYLGFEKNLKEENIHCYGINTR